MIRALRRFVLRHWLRWRIWDTEELIRETHEWLVATESKLPELKQLLADLRIDARLNEIAGEPRYKARSRYDGRRARQPAPYPEFCRHPLRCAGLGCCPRDPCCCD